MKKTIILLLLVFLVPRLLAIDFIPMKLDECLYAVMIEEQIDHITFVPTFLGYETGWKPPLFFWASAFFVSILKNFDFLSIDAIYKLPNIFFGLINLFLVYHIIRHISKDEKFAIVTCFVYSLIPLTVYVDSSVLIDPLVTVFILGSIYSYLRAGKDRKMFLVAGLLTFLAFFTKQVTAMVAPAFAIAYYYQHEKKLLKNPYFVISLLAIPLAFLLNYFLYSDYGQANTVFLDLITNKLIYNLIDPNSLFLSLKSIFFLSGIWFVLSAAGFAKNWKLELGMSAWLLLSVFSFIGGAGTPWYFYPVMPAVAYFATSVMARDEHGKNRLDLFFAIGISAMILVSLVMGYGLILNIKDNYGADKAAGEMMAFKEKVLIMGGYAPGTFSYKIIEEERATGKSLDFGLILMHPEQLTRETAEPFLENYYGPGGEGIADGNFLDMFFDRRIYRKDAEIEEFDYVVLVDLPMKLDEKIIFNENNVTVYKIH